MTRLYGVLIISFPQQPDFPPLTRSLTRSVTSIGRSSDAQSLGRNHIELDVEGVAEHHALVLCDDQGIRVAVLGGQRGEYRNGVAHPVEAGETVTLTNNSQVTIGPIELMVRLAPGLSEPVANAEQLDPLLRVELPLLDNQTQRRYVIDPGTPLRIPLTITNLAERTRQVSIQIDNPPLWNNTVSPLALNLDRFGDNTGRERASATVVVDVPRRAESKAGDKELTITVTAFDPFVTLTEKITVFVRPFVAFEAQLRPEHVTARRRGRFTLVLTNASNWRLPLLLDVRDSEERLRWRVSRELPLRWPLWQRPADAEGIAELAATDEPWAPKRLTLGQPLNLEPGETRLVKLRMWPTGWRLFGRPRRYEPKFSLAPRLTGPDDRDLIQKRTENAGLQTVLELVQRADPSVAPRELKGELTHKPLPGWLPWFAVSLVVSFVVLFTLLRFPQLPQSALHRLQHRRTELVQLGPITTFVDLQGVVVPQRMEALAFPVDGRFERFVLPAGCSPEAPATCAIAADDVVASLQQADTEEELERAQLQAEAAQLQAEAAQAEQARGERQQARDVAQAEQQRQLALDELLRLDRGGEDDVFAAAEQGLAESSDQYILATDTYSTELRLAMTQRTQAFQAVQEAQQQQTTAENELAWVIRYGSHPSEQIETSPGVFENRPLNEVERQAFIDAVSSAKRSVEEKGKVLGDAEAAYQLTVKQGDAEVKAAASSFELTQRTLAELCPGGPLDPRDADGVNTWLKRCRAEQIKGKNGACDPLVINRPEPPPLLVGCRNKQITDAYAATINALRALAAIKDLPQAGAGGGSSNSALVAAEQAVTDARRRFAGSVIKATSSGYLVMAAVRPGDDVRAGQPVAYLITAGTPLEVAAEPPTPGPGQIHTDLPVIIRPLAAPSAVYSGTVRLVPPPSIAGTAVTDAERAIRIALSAEVVVTPLEGEAALPLYSPVRVQATVPLTTRTPRVYWLPPSMVATDSQGSHVIVRQGWLDYRVPVVIGLKTDRQIEIRLIRSQPQSSLEPLPSLRPTLDQRYWLSVGQGWLRRAYRFALGPEPRLLLQPGAKIVAP